MLAVNATTRVYLYMRDVDMRRSYDGLMAIVQAEFARDIRHGDYFMFVNKRRDRIKIMWWDSDGLAIFIIPSNELFRCNSPGVSLALILNNPRFSFKADWALLLPELGCGVKANFLNRQQ